MDDGATMQEEGSPHKHEHLRGCFDQSMHLKKSRNWMRGTSQRSKTTGFFLKRERALAKGFEILSSVELRFSLQRAPIAAPPARRRRMDTAKGNAVMDEEDSAASATKPASTAKKADPTARMEKVD